MKINKFIEQYTEPTLMGEPLSIGSTALRTYLKENRTELEQENIVKFTKKISSLSIEIVNPEGLYKKFA